jgi:hypothetical protein
MRTAIQTVYISNIMCRVVVMPMMMVMPMLKTAYASARL